MSTGSVQRPGVSESTDSGATRLSSPKGVLATSTGGGTRRFSQPSALASSGSRRPRDTSHIVFRVRLVLTW